ncbi:eukaryotic translation initiation factor 5B-like [Cucurbita pepo subsp. pepo]|uniref:eukaryotic translation initiation factor 5B-like n=1 Tax=Cucurbita pepo subsp. pepo TaxID=3664 RepID=UPI000C9D5F13|nr:eukaryotic translation initiation factor 5B-like [Cucurbita pepo subsp. pepo]
MGRKKPTARDDDSAPAAAQGGGKSKKKTFAVDDDEYSIGTELSEEAPVQEENVVITGKKKGKKGNSKVSQVKGDDDEDDDVDSVSEIVITGKKKGKSKKGGSSSAFSASSFGLLEEEGEDGADNDDESVLTAEKDDDEGDDSEIKFSGKKSSAKSSKKSGFSAVSAFSALDDEEDEDVIDNENKVDEGIDDEPVITFTGKKKSSKGAKKGVNAFSGFSGLDYQDEDRDAGKVEDEDVTTISFSGKKKKSAKGSKKSGNSVSVAFADEDNDGDVSISEPDKLQNDGVDEDDDNVIAFSGKKKSSKKKSSSPFITLSDENLPGNDVKDVFVPEVLNSASSSFASDLSKANKTEGVAETSKNKKKKKKSGRTAQEEDDLDKILAELGEGPTISKPADPPLSSQEAKVENPPDLVTPPDASAEKEAEEESTETAAARKKKKKKEKEKEKKAAAAAAAAAEGKDEKIEEVKTEIIEPKKGAAKSKVPDKKVPKHVREMQEAMARRKEEEERRKREEEEKLRKEEEERRRQEELERQAEEAKRRKKEREKEKLLKKKQEGKLLTGKQKEEQRRLEAMRNQILASSGGLPLSASDPSAPTKRPKYQTKKSKPAHHQTNGSAQTKVMEHTEEKIQEKDVADSEILESEKIEPVESIHVEEKSDILEVSEDNELKKEDEDEDEDEWDAKSWDDAVVDLSLKSSFADEELDSETENGMKKDGKNGAQTSRDAGAKPIAPAQKSLPSQPIRSQDIENRKNQPEVEVVDKGKRKDDAVRKKISTSDTTTKQQEENLRSPICCIMGHVDTGKTKLLDCIRGTNVQEGEAGGITQQIGATYFPAENIRERTRELKADAKLMVPGLLVIDTPGHESFTNLRSRGSGLCDLAILVVDIMHGLEPQTIESLNLLRMRNTEFIIALNKVDRLYGWKTIRNAPILKTMKQQSKDVQNEFNMRLIQIITQFKEQGLNTELYYKNKEMGETFSIVPTSAVTGEGIPDLLLLLVQWAQKTMTKKLTYSDEVQCTVLEVKVVEGHGTTIDVILVNGVLHEGDQIVVCGMQGPIVTTIRALLTPHPMKELRVKGTYLHHKEIKAAQGIKITGQGLEHAIAGTSLHVVGPEDDLEDIKDSAMEDMKSVMSRIDKTGEGVCVQASTLGSLEALLEFLKSPAVSIPVSGISIGPVHKKDVMKASVMLEKKKEYATILAFDVKVTPEARELADELGVKIFIADIIYHLFDQFKAYIDNLKEEKKKEAAEEAVFPCVLKILPNCIFNKKDPIVLGVDVIDGIAKVGTPICIPQREFIEIGRIASIENNHKPVDYAKKGQKIAIKIVGHSSEEQQKMYGRHFDLEDELVSHISRKSIDLLKANYRDDLSTEEWRLVVKLKNLFKIQ